MKFPPVYVLVQAAIAGALAAGLVTEFNRYVLGRSASLLTCIVAADALLAAVALAVKAHRKCERRRLQAAFDRPAFGEDGR